MSQLACWYRCGKNRGVEMMPDHSDFCRLDAGWESLHPGLIPLLLFPPLPSENWEAQEPKEEMRLSWAQHTVASEAKPKADKPLEKKNDGKKVTLEHKIINQLFLRTQSVL